MGNKYGFKIDQKKVYIRELVRQIEFSLKEIEKTVDQSPKEFYDRMCSDQRIAFTMDRLYNGDGLIDPLKGAEQNGKERREL